MSRDGIVLGMVAWSIYSVLALSIFEIRPVHFLLIVFAVATLLLLSEEVSR